MKAILAALLAVWAGVARAQDLPALFDVIGVGSDDILNIRAAPNAAAAVYGSYAPDLTGVEVITLSEDGKWGEVGLPEGSGWVALRFLTAQAADPTAFPQPLRCLGTEPFWSFTIDNDIGNFLGPEVDIIIPMIAESVTDRGYSAAFISDFGPMRSITINRETCTDGMSERLFGYSVRLHRVEKDAPLLLAGCCTQAAN